MFIYKENIYRNVTEDVSSPKVQAFSSGNDKLANPELSHGKKKFTQKLMFTSIRRIKQVFQ